MYTSSLTPSVNHPDVMISSTYGDLVQHRLAVIHTLLRVSLFPIGMEFDSAKPDKTLIDSSLEMVATANAYVGILSHRYGHVPKDKERNPNKLSLTELEYREALRLRIPVFMFLMSDEHLVRAADVEETITSKRKLIRFKNEAKATSICAEFKSIEELQLLVLQSMAAFKEQFLLSAPLANRNQTMRAADFPALPSLVAIPNFVSGHTFIGRQAELERLDTWVAGKDPVMVIEAIGGIGKSALAWQWLKRAGQIEYSSVAGMFWYSFYQGGASMDAFLRHVLAYVTESSLGEFDGLKSPDLSRQLLKELRQNRFLIVLDGLERILVAYDRLDAPHSSDDDVPSASKDRACIRPSDDNLLRELLEVRTSKIIITSRLMPTALTDRGTRVLKGVQVCKLAGLSPGDALEMIRSEGVQGDADGIQQYLEENFDNHPLMIGIVAGLINDYIWQPGNFDRWIADPNSRSITEMTNAGIRQRRAQIADIAIRRLEPGTRQLLSRIAALPTLPAPFETIEALSPFSRLADALPRLVLALQDLEQRGLLQWDRKLNTYDLHPVVRGYAFEMLEADERKEIYNQIVDHFESKQADTYENVRSLADIQQSVNTFLALVRAGRYDESAELLMGKFAECLLFSIEEFRQLLVLLDPFFPKGFEAPPVPLRYKYTETYLMNCAAIALRKTNRFSVARKLYESILSSDFEGHDALDVQSLLVNLASCCYDDGRIFSSFEALDLALQIAKTVKDKEAEAITYFHIMGLCRRTGRFAEAMAAYNSFFKLVRTPKRRHVYRIGDVEAELCWLKFHQAKLTYDELNEAKNIAAGREIARSLARLEGELALRLHKPNLAIAAFERAIEMTQRVGLSANELSARLAFALTTVGEVGRALQICERIVDNTDSPPHCELAPAFLKLKDLEQARHHALKGYEWALADGPGFSKYWELAACRSVLHALVEPEPEKVAVDSSLRGRLTCGPAVQAFIKQMATRIPNHDRLN